MRMYRHPDYPFMLANIDRRVVGAEGFEGLECKTTSLFNRADFAGGEIPPEYYWQCMHYMAVTGAKRWHLAVMVLSKAFHRFVIPRDEGDIARLVRREKDFWENNVLAGVPPRPSGLDADDAAIRSVLPPEAGDGGGPAMNGAAMIGTAIIGSGTAATAADLSDIAGELDALAKIKEEKAGLDRRIRATEQLVRLRMGSLEEALAGGWHITNREQAHSSLDTARLKADCPELCARYMKSSPRRVLRITDRTLQ
jgi:predicted phage-related endonuclease